MLGPRSPALAGLAILALYLIVVSCEEPVSEPWFPESIGGGQAGAYAAKLAAWGFELYP